MAILHYFEVVQWHAAPTRPSLTVCPASLLVLRAPRGGSIWTMWRRIFSKAQGHMGPSWSLWPFVQQRFYCFWPMRTLRWGEGAFDLLVCLLSPSVKHTSLLRTCVNCVDIHVWPQCRNIFNIFSLFRDKATMEMSWLFIILHRRWFLKENFRLSQQAILSLPTISASNWPWHQNSNKETR